jgi:hypothetical protein
MLAKCPVISLDQLSLSDRRHGLQLRQIRRTAKQSKLAHAGTYRTGTDEHRKASTGLDRTELFGQLCNPLIVQSSIRFR